MTAMNSQQWQQHLAVTGSEPSPGEYAGEDGPPEHDCPIAVFFGDPITQAYGLGGDWDEWSRIIRCPVCEQYES